MAEVVLTGLSKSFDDVVAVDRVDLTIASGEFFSLLGPSGCGKTTTLRLIAGLESPSEGGILLGGVDVTRKPAHLRDIGMVFQNYALFPHLDVGGNVAYGLKARKLTKPARLARRDEALAQVALSGYDTRRVTELSGGQQQRVAVARAIALHPGLLLLDEPLSNLDARLRVETRAMLRRVQREVGSTAVYVTHDQEEALTLSDRLAVMHQGRLQQVGTPTEIYNQPANAFVATFIGRANLTEVTVLQLAGDEAKVRLADGAELVIRGGPRPPAAGQTALACFRPEALRIEPAGPIQAVVREQVFNGAWREYELDVAGERWQVTEPNHHQPAHPVGHTIGLSAAAGAATLVPAREPGA